MKHYVVILLALFALAACDEDKKESKSCDPLAADSCSDGELCVAQDSKDAVCVSACDPMAPESECGDGESCLHVGDGGYACVTTCEVGSDECGDGWVCVDDNAGARCLEECGEGSECAEGQLCVPAQDTWVCMEQCDPEDRNSCGKDRACELTQDGLYGCFLPVTISGMVFDSATGEPIEGAHVMAADNTGASASNISVTDELGAYEVRVPVTRDASGIPAEGVFTLRASAQDYEKFPHGIRPSIPIDGTTGVSSETGWNISNPATDIALILLPVDMQGLPYVEGQVVVDATADVSPAGVLVVLEGGDTAPMGFSDLDGYFTLFNVPEGSYQAKGYKAFLQLTPVDLEMTATQSATGIELLQNSQELGVVSGSINIVDPGDGDFTTVVLVPTSTFDEAFKKGEVPTGLRSPPPPATPDVSGAFTIEGVPDGDYVVLAAFENDYLVQDPDPNIAGTSIVYISVPETGSYDVELPESFKITGALGITSPGALKPEAVEEPVTFIFEDDSSEDGYLVIVFNAFGDEVWRNDTVPSVSGSATVEVPYEGPALVPGMYYQFRAWSIKDGDPISTTEDLLGVFYLAPVVN